MASRIHVARHERAELEAEIAARKASAVALLDIPASARTPSQNHELQAHERFMVDATKRAADYAREIADLEQLAAADKAFIAGQPMPGARVAPAGRGHTFAEMFGPQAASLDGWRSGAEFLNTIHAGLSDPRLLAATGTTRVGADGGFSVPTELAREWLDASLESEIIRPRADVWGMISGTRQVPGFDASSSVTGPFGFSGGWITEAGEITPEVPLMRLLTLTARKLGLLAEVSNELAQDGQGYDEQLSRAMTAAIGWFLDLAFFTGTGAGQPLGVLNAGCTITVAAEGGQTADTITYTNLVKMFARLHPRSLPNAIWVANSTTIPQLAALTVTVGDGGSHVPVLREADGQFTILTRPVVFTEKVPALGDKGDIGLYDFSQYAVGLRKEITLDKSAHPGFTRDTSHYRGILRGDGQPKWQAAYTPKHGDTLSPFVVLAAR